MHPGRRLVVSLLSVVGLLASSDAASAANVYVQTDSAQGVSAIFQYSVGPAGTLVPLSPASVAESATGLAIALSPSGQNAYVLSETSNSTPGEVSQYTVATDGALTLVSSAATGADAVGLVVSPDGQNVYVASDGAGSTVGPGTSRNTQSRPTGR
jgi:6-phosphogluconolactonase (cycloisomerase 2 family)